MRRKSRMAGFGWKQQVRAKYAFSSRHSLWWKTVLKTGRNEKQRFENEVICRATDFRVLGETITV